MKYNILQTIRGEIAASLQVDDHLETPHVDEDDLSMKKLNEFLFELQALQKEKVGIEKARILLFQQSTILLFQHACQIVTELVRVSTFWQVHHQKALCNRMTLRHASTPSKTLLDCDWKEATRQVQ